MGTSDSRLTEEREHRVTPLELFFDLVFVLSITQVTSYVTHHLTWGGLGHAMILLALLWWAWGAYAWLTNSVDAEGAQARIVVLAASAGMLVVSLAIPDAFDGEGLLFAVAYFVVRALHVALYEVSTRGDDQHEAIIALAPFMIAAPAIAVIGGALGGTAQVVVWIVALVVDYCGPLISFNDHWRVDAGHFVERHGLIIIIALGESVVAIGVGASGIPVTAGLVMGALLGMALVSALWWAYFDVVAVVAERHLRAAQGAARNAQARDSYSYLHLPMMAGIVLMAVGIKATIAHHDQPLDEVSLACLYGGFALYFLGHIGFRLRNVRSLNRQRLVAIGLAMVAWPLVSGATALAALAVLTALAVCLIAYEALRFAEARHRVRSGI